MPEMRAKMRVNRIDQLGEAQRLVMNAVYKDGAYPADGSDEDNTFAKFTPQADLNITINNPALVGKFQVGETYYVDFTLTPDKV